MDNIGIVTFFTDNYGSALQCYATKYTLQKMGVNCDVIYKKKSISDRLKNRILLKWKELRDKQFRNVKIYLTSESRQKIENFVNERLAPIGFSERELRTIGKNDHYIGFITGSDQVWNLSNNPEGHYFLDFTIPSKRIAFSVSMGSDRLSKYQEKKLQRKISRFELISAREESASRILERVYGKEVETISDPTIMLTPDEWRGFSKDGMSFSESYVFVHFLDAPSDLAIEYLRKVENLYSKIVVFGYRHRRVEEFTKAQVIDGDPIDYVSLISEASLVLTDSYHTTLFSIYFNRDFHVYKRRYQTKFSQNSRIQHLLQLYNCLYSFDCSDEIDQTTYNNRADIMRAQRDRTVGILQFGIKQFRIANEFPEERK